MTGSTSALRRAAVAAAFLLPWLATAPAARAGELPSPATPWTFRARALLTGNSDESVPAGYTIYSGVTLGVALERRLGARLGVGLDLRSESREFDRRAPGGRPEPLGSVELLPVTVALRYRAGGGRLHPYAGVGANLTVAWEKSGQLDSLDMRPHVGPALQFGLDLDLGPRALCDLHLGWNTLTADIRDHDRRVFRMKIDPIALGLGVGFRF